MVATLEGCQTKQRVEKGKFQKFEERRKGVGDRASKVTAKDTLLPIIPVFV